MVPNALAPGYRPRSLLTEPVILGAGRLATEKQWPNLISAFGRVADRIPEWRIRIFGEGQGRFEAMGAVRELGLWDRVELPGPDVRHGVRSGPAPASRRSPRSPARASRW